MTERKDIQNPDDFSDKDYERWAYLLLDEESQTMNSPGTLSTLSRSQLILVTFNYGATGMWGKDELEKERDKLRKSV